MAIVRMYWSLPLHSTDVTTMRRRCERIERAQEILGRELQEESVADADVRRWYADVPADSVPAVLDALHKAAAAPNHIDVPPGINRAVIAKIDDLGISWERIDIDGVVPCPRCGGPLYIECRLGIRYDGERNVLDYVDVDVDAACPDCGLFGFDEETEQRHPYNVLTQHVAALYRKLTEWLWDKEDEKDQEEDAHVQHC